MKKAWNQFKSSLVFRPLLVFICLILFCEIFTGGDFLRLSVVDGHLYGRLIDVFRNGSKYVILAVGMTMVIATGGTDISVGSVMAISGTVACSIVDGRLFPQLGGNVPMAVLIALAAGVLCGMWNGFLVAKIKVQPIVATMILMTAGRGIAQLIGDGKIVTINNDAYYLINGGYLFGLPIPMYIAAGVLVAALLMFRKTAFGMSIEAIGINQDASRLAGIKVERNLFLIYVFCGLMAALAGIIESAGIKGADANNAGLMIEMYGILAVAIGGTSMIGGRFSLIASAIGGLIVQGINTMILAFGVAPELTKVVTAIIVIVICLFQSPKFLARAGRFVPKKKKNKKGAVA